MRGSASADREYRRSLCRASERRLARDSATSCLVGQSFSNRSPERGVRTSKIVEAKPLAVIVSEIELGSVAVQVRLTDVEVTAEHTALEDREEVLNRVGVPEGRTDIQFDGILDNLASKPRERAIKKTPRYRRSRAQGESER
jgi:hypothetical protein